MNTVTLSGALVIKGKRSDEDDDDAVFLGVTKKTETPYARFRVREYIFSTKFDDQARYQNYICYAYGKLAERIEIMKMKKGSRINLTGKLVFTDDALKESSAFETDDDQLYGKFIQLRGLRIEVIDLEYAYYSSPKSQENKDKSKQRNIDDESADGKSEDYSIPEGDVVNLDDVPIATGRVFQRAGRLDI